MSIYTECSQALSRLRLHPPADQGGVFTDHDVVLLMIANSTLQNGDGDFKQALHEANNLCGQMFRALRLCRYGPVELPGGVRDYGRIASRIVYADALSGPSYWHTPNGSFPKLMNKDDDITRPGRRIRSVRSDLHPWDTQDLRGADAKELQRQLIGREQRIRVLEQRIAVLEGGSSNVEGVT